MKFKKKKFSAIIKRLWLFSLFIQLAIAAPASALTFALPSGKDNIVGQVQMILSQPGDDFHAIAQRYDVGYYEMVEANPTLTPTIELPVRTLVLVPTRFILPDAPRKDIVINLPELRLYYYPPGGREVVTYPVGIGRQGWQTPETITKIILKRKNPTWVVPPDIKAYRASQGVILPTSVPPGPDNPLGDYAMSLAIPAYAIHGTNDPTGVGMRSSSGCIRLYPDDIEVLFHMVSAGTRVNIINQPLKLGRLNNNLYLESHLPLQEDQLKYHNNFSSLLDATIATATKNQQANIDWVIAQQAAGQEQGFPILIGKIVVPGAT